MSITSRVVLVLTVMLVIPESSALYLVESNRVERLQVILAVHLALTLGLMIPLAKGCSYLIIGRDISSLFVFCQQIKNGNYNFSFTLPNEEEDEHELIKLKRLLNWMAHSLSVRESTQQHQLGEKEEREKHFQNLSMRDELTQLFNRRYFNVKLRERLAVSLKNGESLCLMLIDVDNFKKINDTFGHQKGDELLKILADILFSSIRSGADIPFRYGGDEFGIILPGISSAYGRVIAERIKENYALAAPAITSLSIGVAFLCQRYLNSNAAMEDLIKTADDCVYRAKKNGRNGIVVDEDERHLLRLAE